MIEKLNVASIQIESDNSAKLELSNKINEFVDAVNSLRDDCNLLMGYIAPEDKCEPAENGNCAKNAQDPYAEQRKWIGKLCRFWDKDYKDCIYDKLHHIDPNCVYKYARRDLGGGYQHCEPVKPDDDIVYKGCKDE